MNFLKTGQFFGKTNQNLKFEGLRITDTVYTHDYVDWHYHEFPYFTFLLNGGLTEINKKETYHCQAGDLIFHNWDEPHANIKPGGFSRGFHLEVESAFLQHYGFDLAHFQGNQKIKNTDMVLLMYRILKESKVNDAFSPIAIQTLLIDLLNQHRVFTKSGKKPGWVLKIDEILHEQPIFNLNLSTLAQELNIHPVHLSRDFPRYFGSTLGEYLRKIRVQKALSLMFDAHTSLTDVAYAAGFSDQSHFIRCFKAVQHLTPKKYRSLFLGTC